MARRAIGQWCSVLAVYQNYSETFKQVMPVQGAAPAQADTHGLHPLCWRTLTQFRPTAGPRRQSRWGWGPDSDIQTFFSSDSDIQSGLKTSDFWYSR